WRPAPSAPPRELEDAALVAAAISVTAAARRARPDASSASPSAWRRARRPYVAVDGAPARYDVVHVGSARYSLITPEGRQVEATVEREADGAVTVQMG